MQNTPSAIIGMEIALNCGGNMRATSTGIPKRHVKFFWSSQLRIGWGKNTYDSVAHSYIQLMFSYMCIHTTQYTVGRLHTVLLGGDLTARHESQR